MKNSGDNLMKTEGEESGELSPEGWVCVSQEIHEEPSKSRKQTLTPQHTSGERAKMRLEMPADFRPCKVLWAMCGSSFS